MTSGPDNPHLGKRLDTWKEIGAFFGRDERTVKRWETTRGLPVHRVPGAGRANVYAYTAELTEWLNGPSAKSALRSDADPLPDSREPTAAPARPNSNANLLLLTTVLVAVSALFLVLKFWYPSKLSTQSSTPAPIVSASHKPDPQAQDLYLKGIYFWHKRTPESLNQAVDYFTQAIVRDPNYAEAYVGLANCYNLLREYSSMPAEEAYPRARTAAQRAIALDDLLSAAHSSLAFVDFWGFWDFANAEKEFQRALALDPNSVPAHHWYATALLCLGRFPESVAEIDKAQQLDPQSISILADRALILYQAGQPDQGIRSLRELESSDPTFLSPHKYLADIYLSRGDPHNFLAESKQVAALMHDDQRLAIVNAADAGFANSGQAGMLRAILKIQKNFYDQNKLSAYDLARTYGLLHDKPQALAYLHIALSKREPALLAIPGDQAFQPFHQDPNFQSLLRQIGLPAR